MKRFSLASLFAIAAGFAVWTGMDNEQPPAAAAPAAAKMTGFKIDPIHSKALFRIQHLGAGRFYGRFNDVQGSFQYDGNETAVFDVAVAVDSVDTGNEKLDGHLKSPDFFNAKEHATLTFKGKSSVRDGQNRYRVKGELTIHGVTRPIAVDVEMTGDADKGHGRRCGFEAIFTISRSDFDMKYGLAEGTLGDQVQIIVSLEGTAE